MGGRARAFVKLQRLRARLAGLCADRRGNAIMLTVGAIPMLIGSAGMAIDTVQWTLWKRQLQRSADSAALAGAFALAQQKDVRGSALHDLESNNDRTLSGAPVIETPPTSGKYAGQNQTVRVILQTSQVLPFTGSFLATPPVISALGTASVVQNGKYCVIALEKTSQAGITMQGNATVDLGCGLATNSKAANAVVAGGSASVSASPVAAVGGIQSSSAYAPGTKLLPYSLPQPDPFADLPQPEPSGCTGKVVVNPQGSRTLDPGCYKGFDIKGDLQLNPGTYFIDGDINIGAQARVTGTGVTLVLTSSNAASNPSSIGTIDINGGAYLDLSAPDTGTYAGVLIYQDRRALDDDDDNKLNGNSASKLQGAFYFPRQQVNFSGTAGMKTDCVQIVGRRVEFIGNSSISNTCPQNSGAKAFDGIMVKLVE